MSHPRTFSYALTCVAAAGIMALSACTIESASQTPDMTGEAPIFEVDPLWPKPLPNHWILGSTIGVGVDSRDHVFIIHRQTTFSEVNEIGATLDPPTSECCVPAPNVLEFDPEGNLVNSWGGPGEGYDWPTSNHGLSVDHHDNIWIGGNGEFDAQLLKFSRDGEFLMQVGVAEAQPNSNSTEHFSKVAKISFDGMTDEAFVADGYGNRRVVVLDSNTGEFKRYWGAYGNEPSDELVPSHTPDGPPQQQFRTPVHCADPSADGLVYVCDRAGNRIQVFQSDGTFVREAFIANATLGGRIGVGHHLLARSRAALPVRGRRDEQGGPRAGPGEPRGPHQLRRRRPPAGPVLRRAQRRHRLAGQPLHHRDLRGQAAPEVRLHGDRAGDRGAPGRALAPERR